MPRVSVILTSYNHEKFIGQAIDSVLNQTFKDLELLIIDDCSSDNSWDVIQGFTDKRIKSLRNDKNKGHNIQDLIPLSQGQYIAIHHSDDVWESEKIEKQVAYLDTHPEVAACFTWVQLIDERGVNFEPPTGSFYRERFDQPNRSRVEWLRYFFEDGNCLCHPSVLIRKEMYEKCNLLNVLCFYQIDDFIMWIRLCLNENIYIIQERLTKFRLRKGEQTNSSADRIDTQIRSLTENYMMLDEFIKINDANELIQVFPKAQNYYSPKGINTSFALSRLLIEKSLPSMQLKALMICYMLLNDKQTAEQIKTLYGYTYLDFVKESAQYDVFYCKRRFTSIQSSLFIDFGNGFNESDRITQEVYVNASGWFYVKFDLSSFASEFSIKGLRFDPDEGHLWDICIDGILADGIDIRSDFNNSVFKTEKFDSFITADPIYMLSGFSEDCQIVEIKGFIRSLSVSVFAELENRYNAISSQHIELENKYNDLQGEYHLLSNEYKKLISSHEELLVQHALLEQTNIQLEHTYVDVKNKLDTILRSRWLRFWSRFSKSKVLFKNATLKN